MFHLDLCVIALILTSTSAWNFCSDPHKGPCKKTNQCKPSVMPMNSTHLLVNWENIVSEGCEESHIEKMEIVILESTEKRKTVPVSQKETLVLANPCLAHIVRVELFLTESYARTYGRNSLRSASTEYNKIEPANEKYPFGGLLGNKVVPQICLKENGTITIPSPPEALKNCEIKSGGVTSGDLQDSDFDEVGATARVLFNFKNPQNPSIKSYKDFAVEDIQACTNDHSRESGSLK